MQNPHGGIVIADSRNHPCAQVSRQRGPGVFHCRLLKGKAAALDQGFGNAQNARGFGPVQVEATRVLPGQNAQGDDLCPRQMFCVRWGETEFKLPGSGVEVVINRRVCFGDEGKAARARCLVSPDVLPEVRAPVRAGGDEDKTRASDERRTRQTPCGLAAAVLDAHAHRAFAERLRSAPQMAGQEAQARDHPQRAADEKQGRAL